MAKKETTTTNIQDSRRAANNFLRLGRIREARNAPKEESAFDLSERIREMSDEDFDKAVAAGTLTPEQIRKAGEYDFDVYMGDVWAEDPNNDGKPEPTYDEFMSDPAKYGYNTTDDWRKIYRYNPNRYKK